MTQTNIYAYDYLRYWKKEYMERTLDLKKICVHISQIEEVTHQDCYDLGEKAKYVDEAREYIQRAEYYMSDKHTPCLMITYMFFDEEKCDVLEYDPEISKWITTEDAYMSQTGQAYDSYQEAFEAFLKMRATIPEKYQLTKLPKLEDILQIKNHQYFAGDPYQGREVPHRERWYKHTYKYDGLYWEKVYQISPEGREEETKILAYC